MNIGLHRFVDGEKLFLDVRRSVARLKFAETPGVYGFVDIEMEPEIIETQN